MPDGPNNHDPSQEGYQPYYSQGDWEQSPTNGQQQNPYGYTPTGTPQRNPYAQNPAGAPQQQNPFAMNDPYAASWNPNFPPSSNPYPAPYSHWGKRVGANILDGLIMFPFTIVAAVLLVVASRNVTETTDPVTGQVTQHGSLDVLPTVLAALVYLAAFIFSVWNNVVRQGKTGQSLGKKWMNISVVNESTGQPIGIGRTLLRGLAHLLDEIPFMLGFLWPLWDSKRQTFADKVMHTVVIDVPAK